MQLDWTTFTFELINFLVLVWLLKHFLYRPVLEVMDRRQRAIRETVEAAEAQSREAQALQGRYQQSLEAWQQEQAQQQTQLQQTLAQQRREALAALEQELETEREKARVVSAREAAQQRQLNEIQAVENGRRFAARLLRGVAGAEVEQGLIRLFLDELRHLPEERAQELRQRVRQEELQPQIESAFPLSEAMQAQLQQALEGLLDQAISPTYQQQPQLVAGVRVALGERVLEANVADELELFGAAALESEHEH